MPQPKTSKARAAKATATKQPDPPAEAPEAATKTGHERPVEKVQNGVWWCPYCDHSQPVGDFETCQGCGAKRGS